MSLLNDYDPSQQKTINGMLRTTHRATRKIAEKFDNDLLFKTPLEFLLEVINNEDIGITHRINAAKSSLPYIHQALPQQMEVSGPGGGAIEYNLLANDAHRRLGVILEAEFDEPEGEEGDIVAIERKESTSIRTERQARDILEQVKLKAAKLHKEEQ